jgi:hypothetical protein
MGDNASPLPPKQGESRHLDEFSVNHEQFLNDARRDFLAAWSVTCLRLRGCEVEQEAEAMARAMRHLWLLGRVQARDQGVLPL